MADIEIQDESIEVETTGYSYPKYYAIIGFQAKEIEGYGKEATIRLDCENRRECTFSKVQEEISQWFEKEINDEYNITKITSVKIEERESIKSGFNLEE